MGGTYRQGVALLTPGETYSMIEVRTVKHTLTVSTNSEVSKNLKSIWTTDLEQIISFINQDTECIGCQVKCKLTIFIL